MSTGSCDSFLSGICSFNFLFFFSIDKKYTGFIKLKQNWDDGLQKKTNPKTLILAGNIESAVRLRC